MSLWILLFIVPLLFGVYAQYKVSSTYKRYSQVPSRGRITGREAALYVMQKGGVSGVSIEEIPGHLTDHYDPTRKVLALSQENYRGTSLAALGVAAHEAGHAIQHAVGYSMLKARMALVPATMFASKILPFVILGGVFFMGAGALFGRTMIWAGVICYAVLALFQLITLPVEFDASRRAKQELSTLGIIERDEAPGVARTLDAAALTYVAAFVATLGTLLYYLLILFGGRRN